MSRKWSARSARWIVSLCLGAVLAPAWSSTPGAARFETFEPPVGIAGDWGEPSIGVNWKTEQSFANSAGAIPNGGTVMSFGGFGDTALRVIFNDCASPAIVSWENTVPLRGAAAPRVAGDPILWTDSQTGRTLVSQLVGITPTCTTEITDDDGKSFTPSLGTGVVAGIDHQTYGGGPFAAPLPPGVVYPNAVYYCAQSLADASCSLSVDGGRSFGPAVVIYTLADCGGLHGHVKVSPVDGTVYIPNRDCGSSQQGLIVSTDNGATWTVKLLPGTTAGEYDPSVGVASDGTVYFGYTAGDGHPHAIVSHDRGDSWDHDIDLGALISPNIVASAFPAAVAGDAQRAAIAFFGTSTEGSYQSADFPGLWYLYVATTYDGGATWTVANATPGDPIQRGGICGGGDCRNLLDFFDATIDKRGRVLVGYEDGCVGPCVTGTAQTYMAKAAIARQSGGKRMFAAYDPAEPAAPKAPRLTALADAQLGGVRLSWTTPDDGGSDLVAYNIYRKGATGDFQLIHTVTRTDFVDFLVEPGVGYTYRVTAVNGSGEGPYCELSEATVVVNLDPCSLPGALIALDDANTQLAVSPALDVRSVHVAEPRDMPGKIVVTMKVESLAQVPPGFLWAVLYKSTTELAGGELRFAGMMTDLGTPRFVYGHTNTVSDPVVGLGTRYYTVDGALATGSKVAADGTITLVLDRSAALLGNNPNPGEILRRFRAAVVPSAGYSQQVPTTGGLSPETFRGGWYQLRADNACDLPPPVNTPPTAVLSALPRFAVPGATVTLSGRASADVDAGDYPALYSFSFGDGSPAVEQYTPRVAHRYDRLGSFPVTLTVRDTHGAVSSASVTVKIVPPVKAVADSFAVKAGARGVVLRVLANDVSQAPMTVAAITQPGKGGAAKISSDHKYIVYTPKAGFVGTEKLTYTVRAAGSSAQATVTINVQ